MSIKKSLYEVSWQVSEDEYRQDAALSYSTLAKFERSGFNGLDTLFDKVESPALTFGSAVDAIITGGMDEFNERFCVAEFPPVSDTVAKIVKDLFLNFDTTYSSLSSIPDEAILRSITIHEYQPNWKPETRVKVLKEKGEAYYKVLYLAYGKTLLDTATYEDVMRTVEALRTSAATQIFFGEPTDDNIEHLYQLKFKATLNGIEYRCMFDELIVDHETKTIQPIDLKTSGKKEWDFYKSFLEWNYQIQNRLYVRILQEIIKNDEYFKEFKILPYKDVVVSRNSLTPLVWDCSFTFHRGTVTLGKNKQIELRDPEEIGKELSYYLFWRPTVPQDIDGVGSNDLTTWINKL
jgi:hypothetical protein